MHSTIRTIAPNSIHTYFDVCPENPNGSLLCWFAFDGKPMTEGSVMIGDLNGGNPISLFHCHGSPHSAAHQGWLDNDHIFFSANGHVHVAHRNGTIVERIPGAIDTIDQASQRGLMHSHGWIAGGGTPTTEACFCVDLKTKNVSELLNRNLAFNLIANYYNLKNVPLESMNFQHTKWAPDGQSWFVVFTNETYRRTNPDIPRVKAILLTDQNGQTSYVGDFGHHPNWLPDSSGILAYDNTRQQRIIAWDIGQQQHSNGRLFHTMQIEGHPSVSPNGRYLTTDGHQGPDDMCVELRTIANNTSEIIAVTAWPHVAWQINYPKQRLCHAHPVWSHDSQRIYFNAVENEMPVLKVCDITD